MMYCILLIICVQIPSDSIVPEPPVTTKSYTKQVILNGILGVSFGLGAGFCYTRGNAAYEDYQNSPTIVDALDNWNKVTMYDNIRNVCAIGATIFVVRALYYQFKNINSAKTSTLQPKLNYCYAQGGIMKLGLEAKF